MRILLLLPMLCCASGAMAQGTLRIGIGDDPDALDPRLNRAASGHQPLTVVRDKLFDVTTELKLEPAIGHQLRDCRRWPCGDPEAARGPALP